VAKLIGLSGYARSGKDTVADFLVANHGFTKVSFAQPMRDALYALDPIVGEHEPVRLQSVIDKHGWDGYKASEFGDEIRALMQRLGTDVARKQWYEGFWVDLAIDKALELLDTGKNVVFTDARFPNEAEMIKYYNGEVWRIERDGVGAANAHVSETALDTYGFDRIIYNNSTIADLHEEVAQWI
jgi:dephospho-CoA kinase